MLIYSMSVSVDGFIADREGGFWWTVPSDEQFRFHLEQVRQLGGYLCGRRLYETMLVWETDPSMRDTEPGAAFADVWCALSKVVFSRTLDNVQGNARLAAGSVAEEVTAALGATDKDVSIGGAGLAAAAIESAFSTSCARFASGPPRGRHAVSAAGHRGGSARSGRGQDVRLAGDLRALQARPRWVIRAIIGPCTNEQPDDLLASCKVALADEILDRIDEIVPPGTDVGTLDLAYRPPGIQPPLLRRRPVAERAAA